VAERWTDILGSPLAIIHKRRDPDVPNEVKMFEVVGEVKDRVCVLVDDMIDTAGTLTEAANAVLSHGAKEVYAAASHGVLSGPAIERIRNSKIKKVIITDTIPLREDAKDSEKFVRVSVADLLAEAIYRIHHYDSVSSLFT
jgi:ribose-phosphate pyrophosphokinase